MINRAIEADSSQELLHKRHAVFGDLEKSQQRTTVKVQTYRFA